MIKFSKDKVKLLHQLMAEATGGSVGVRDEALLESAIEGIYATFGGEELYPSKEETGMAVASGKMDYEGLLNWVIDHK